MKHLAGPSVPSELSLYESKFGKGARIIWTVGTILSLSAGAIGGQFVFGPSIAAMTTRSVISRVCAIHRGDHPPQAAYPRAEDQGDGRGPAKELSGGARWPAAAVPARDCTGALIRSIYLGGSGAGRRDRATTVRYPPAVEQEDAYNLVKFYTLERSLVYSILAATFTEKLEFPFLPDETEHLIISLSERRSVLLIGRRNWQDDDSRAAHVAQVRGASAIMLYSSSPSSAKAGDVKAACGSEGAAGPPSSEPAPEPPARSRDASTAEYPQLRQMFVGESNPARVCQVAKSLQSGFVASLVAAGSDGCESAGERKPPAGVRLAVARMWTWWRTRGCGAVGSQGAQLAFFCAPTTGCACWTAP